MRKYGEATNQPVMKFDASYNTKREYESSLKKTTKEIHKKLELLLRVSDIAPITRFTCL